MRGPHGRFPNSSVSPSRCRQSTTALHCSAPTAGQVAADFDPQSGRVAVQLQLLLLLTIVTLPILKCASQKQSNTAHAHSGSGREEEMKGTAALMRPNCCLPQPESLSLEVVKAQNMKHRARIEAPHERAAARALPRDGPQQQLPPTTRQLIKARNMKHGARTEAPHEQAAARAPIPSSSGLPQLGKSSRRRI